MLALAVVASGARDAAAMVGGAVPATEATGTRHAVLLVGSRGSSCTGFAIARRLVLTAAHCVLPGADYKLVEFDAARRPVLRDIAEVVRHPQFSLPTLLAHRATADVAVVKLSAPLPNPLTPATLASSAFAARPGDLFAVAGFGVTVRGEGKTGGTLRAATLEATGRPGPLQLRLFDPRTRGEAPGFGACTADSGAPVFAVQSGGLVVAGVVSWSTGPKNAAGCGGLTGVTPLARYRAWIVETARRMGEPLP